jgi:AraC-like DNA-binding protein
MSILRVISLGYKDWAALAEQGKYRAPAVAALLRISLRQLERHCKRQFGCSPQSWLNERRMISASRMLAKAESVKQVAFDLGFKRPSHFCRLFKSFHGLSATQFVLAKADSLQTSKTTSRIRYQRPDNPKPSEKRQNGCER